jgi:hypothetical protein
MPTIENTQARALSGNGVYIGAGMTDLPSTRQQPHLTHAQTKANATAGDFSYARYQKTRLALKAVRHLWTAVYVAQKSRQNLERCQIL